MTEPGTRRPTTIRDHHTPTGYLDLDTLRAEVDASCTDEQRQADLNADAAAETQIALAELVYQMRTQAGISQTELARRMSTRQPFISDLERGGRTPTIATLSWIAHATGNRLRVTAEPASPGSLYAGRPSMSATSTVGQAQRGSVG